MTRYIDKGRSRVSYPEKVIGVVCTEANQFHDMRHSNGSNTGVESKFNISILCLPKFTTHQDQLKCAQFHKLISQLQKSHNCTLLPCLTYVVTSSFIFVGLQSWASRVMTNKAHAHKITMPSQIQKFTAYSTPRETAFHTDSILMWIESLDKVQGFEKLQKGLPEKECKYSL